MWNQADADRTVAQVGPDAVFGKSSKCSIVGEMARGEAGNNCCIKHLITDSLGLLQL
jgi:hypothetical protein